jgi:hypothetical protein
MLIYLLAFFIVVMAGGAAFALLERRGRALPLKFSVSHGVAGVLAIVLLLMQALAHPGNYPVNLSIVVFMIAALGGLLLFAFRASRQTLPLGVVLLHAGIAVVGLVFLAVGCLRVSG